MVALLFLPNKQQTLIKFHTNGIPYTATQGDKVCSAGEWVATVLHTLQCMAFLVSSTFLSPSAWCHTLWRADIIILLRWKLCIQGLSCGGMTVAESYIQENCKVIETDYTMMPLLILHNLCSTDLLPVPQYCAYASLY